MDHCHTAPLMELGHISTLAGGRTLLAPALSVTRRRPSVRCTRQQLFPGAKWCPGRSRIEVQLSNPASCWQAAAHQLQLSVPGLPGASVKLLGVTEPVIPHRHYRDASHSVSYRGRFVPSVSNYRSRRSHYSACWQRSMQPDRHQVLIGSHEVGGGPFKSNRRLPC